MIRRLRWCWDRLVSSLVPIDEECVACCGCGRYRIDHVFLDSGETWCDNCFRMPGTRLDLPHYSFGGDPLVRWTWAEVGWLLQLRRVQIRQGWPA